jgi:hypothetical protein
MSNRYYVMNCKVSFKKSNISIFEIILSNSFVNKTFNSPENEQKCSEEFYEFFLKPCSTLGIASFFWFNLG